MPRETDRLRGMTDRQLFPHFVCRVAGVPVGALEDLAAVESVASCLALRESEAELGRLRGPLSEALFEAVGGLEDLELWRGEEKVPGTSPLRPFRPQSWLAPIWRLAPIWYGINLAP